MIKHRRPGRRDCQSIIAVPVLLVCLLWLTGVPCPASETRDRTWSFEFNQAPVARVLKELSRTTGIRISTNMDLGGLSVTRVYRKVSFSTIIRDIFKQTSHVLAWRYQDKQIASVDVWICEGESNGTLYSQASPSGKGRSVQTREAGQNHFHGKNESEDKAMGPSVPGVPRDPGSPEALFHPELFE